MVKKESIKLEQSFAHIRNHHLLEFSSSNDNLYKIMRLYP